MSVLLCVVLTGEENNLCKLLLTKHNGEIQRSGLFIVVRWYRPGFSTRGIYWRWYRQCNTDKSVGVDIVYVCPVCEREYKSISGFRDHVLKKHDRNLKGKLVVFLINHNLWYCPSIIFIKPYGNWQFRDWRVLLHLRWDFFKPIQLKSLSFC